MIPQDKNCYTCTVRKENCGEARRISPVDWTRHVCVLWFPHADNARHEEKAEDKKVSKLLSKAVRLAGDFLTDDEYDPMNSIYNWTKEALAELKKLEKVEGK
jgi:hypothetical protein